MKRTLLGLFVIVAMLGMISCESASNPMAPRTADFSSNSMAKGGNGGGGSNSGETAYTCTSEGEFSGYNETNDPDYAIYEYTLWAGQHNDAGTVTITNDDDNIYVTYNTNETADLGEVHVYLWDDLADIPSKRPSPGHADFVVENINADSYTVVMPADISCGSTFYISTHAALVGNDTDGDEAGSGDNSGETAYSGGADAPDCFDGQKGAWWGYATYTVECFYDISGTVYEDFNHDGGMNGDENSLEGICVELLDASGEVVASTTTDANGGYLFEHVAGGAGYTVQTCSVPGFDHVETQNGGGFTIEDLGSDMNDIDFGFGPLYDLSGTVYDDANDNSDDDGEAGLAGITVSLLDGDGNLIASTTTDANGDYLFENLPSGDDYQLVVGDLAGMDATENAGGYVIIGLDGDMSDIDFGYHTPDNGGNNEYDDCDTNQDGVVDAAEQAACDEVAGDSDFPLWGQGISHVVLAFTAASAPNGDSDYYLIKIDEYPDAGNDDLDDDIDSYLAQLVGMGLLNSSYELIGSSIKGGRQITSFYNYGSYNNNGEASDAPPASFPLTYNDTSDNEGNQNLIDETVDWIAFQ